MKISLKTKLSLSYIAIVMVCVALTSIFSNIYFERHFREYIMQNQEQKYKDIVASVGRQYEEKGQWRYEGIQNIGINALEQGLIIKVIDITDKIVWDARTYNNGACEQIISNMARKVSKYYPNLKGEYVEKTFPVFYGEKKVGSVAIGHYGPLYLSDHDIIFLRALNKVFVTIGIFSMFIAFTFGILMSNRLTKPISRVIDTAQMIAKGYFGGRSHEKSTTKEINQLTATVNNLAETLEMQEKLRRRLTEDVAHELRTPLATLQSHLEAMIDGIWELDGKRLKSCHDEIIRLNRLVDDLERLAQYESENLILNYARFDISSLVEQIVLNFEHDYHQKGVEIYFDGKKEILVCADKDKISQVIVNLISNALKYTNKGGKVNVSVSSDQDAIGLRVKDTGIGISKDNLPFIFERFYRVEKSRNRITGGAGIGLTITKAIVEAHRGKIMVESSLNEGTEFIVMLPKNRQSC
ncbi:sensor histidine kinase [Thermotalea metallivorans]|uniref:histidine kinase n=1 Tax=Thermotalea metallivorans TaxID=520762 RepID=A0A140KZE3_9FIRM|nr:ATP-binding protein [Thermotalea metallivorans]KXG73668.1 Signal transduction histidine-protein kinase BaeS [Thermotalea metallivorans]